MSGAVLNSPNFYRGYGKENIERVSTLMQDTWSTACELTMLILSISVAFTVNYVTVASLIMKRSPISSCSFTTYCARRCEVW